jgi:hypothetical protein
MALTGKYQQHPPEAQNAMANAMANARDPLGILALNETLRRKTILLLRIAGYGGIAGIVGLWVLKQCGVVNGLPAWMQVLPNRV